MKRKTALYIYIMMIIAACMLLTSCDPALPLNPKYSYTSFGLELGEAIPDDIGEFVDLSSLSPAEAEFVRGNTEILYDGEPAVGKFFDAAGNHTLTITYKGRQYRKYNITITDSEPPYFTASRDLYTFEGISLNESLIDTMFEASDNSGTAEISIVKSEVDYRKAGEYPVTATATDPSGNTTEQVAHIVVQKPEYGAMGTYVFVSISGQHLTYFVDGEAVLDCPVVTGNTYNDHSTPRGTFTLNYKSRNVTLRGFEDDGEPYESFVNYWMAFIGSSVGMHDATWRSNFGGNIYQGGGSHGCVNMPYSSAAALYGMIEPGTPVLVY